MEFRKQLLKMLGFGLIKEWMNEEEEEREKMRKIITYLYHELMTNKFSYKFSMMHTYRNNGELIITLTYIKQGLP